MASAFAPCLLLLTWTPCIVPSSPGAQVMLQLHGEVSSWAEKQWSSLSPHFSCAALWLPTFPRLVPCTSARGGDDNEGPDGGQQHETWRGSY